MGTANAPQFVSIAQAAQILSVSTKTIYRLIYAGQLPAKKIGRCVRVKLDDLEKAFPDFLEA
ncbi:DNA binding domain-containing protein, excisionase family [Actinobaculum suis]|uniref:DNA binding domain-containing protein, excisionase family n=1 Tax=Actinobaculum suis TaxID=1657 RepID=A0A1G7ADU2_9ACTO|nr:helix-turn-helix domain-containing protein [Actinobaculum suis]MDY5152589.1 helix-turn-helix domain-containing protein [Actinobaculum suis]SDE13094.1 DNA binding domain-containing protein, excisionase family [Actinobaculum suis]